MEAKTASYQGLIQINVIHVISNDNEELPQSTIEWKCPIFYTPRIRNDEIKNNGVIRE